jgi:hypothetical protein
VIICDVCGSDRETVRVGEYTLKLIENYDDEDDRPLKGLDIHLCDQCIERIMLLIKGMLKHKDGFSINNFLKPVDKNQELFDPWSKE